VLFRLAQSGRRKESIPPAGCGGTPAGVLSTEWRDDFPNHPISPYRTTCLDSGTHPIGSVGGSEIRLTVWLYHNPMCCRWGAIFRTIGPLQLVLVLLHRHPDQLAPRTHTGFPKKPLQNGFHVTLRNLQLERDLLVRQSFEHEAQHSALALGEYRRTRRQGPVPFFLRSTPGPVSRNRTTTQVFLQRRRNRHLPAGAILQRLEAVARQVHKHLQQTVVIGLYQGQIAVNVP